MFELIPNPLVIPAGIVVGVLVAAPVGPVNILCIQRAIERGAAAGLIAGLGAVLGDGLIALLAAFGVGQISGAITRYRDAIQGIGGLVLLLFGIKLAFTPPAFVMDAPDRPEWSNLRDLVWDVPKSFFLTITNPGAVLGLIAIFGGVSSFVGIQSTPQALWLVASIVTGSLVWWMFLAALIGRIRHRMTGRRVAQINRVAGFLLAVFGIVILAELLMKALRLTP